MSVSVQRPLMVPVLLLKVMCMSGKARARMIPTCVEMLFIYRQDKTRTRGND